MLQSWSYRPLIPIAFVANLFRTARVSRPRRSVDRGSPGDAPTVGDCGRRGRAGQETLPEPSRIGGEIPFPPCEGGIQGVLMARQHGTCQPAPDHRDGIIRFPASYPTRARERPSSEVWCQPAGARESHGRIILSGLGPAPPGSNMPPHSGLGCKGPE